MTVAQVGVTVPLGVAMATVIPTRPWAFISFATTGSTTDPILPLSEVGAGRVGHEYGEFVAVVPPPQATRPRELRSVAIVNWCL